jgi:hypothetical protein
MLGYASSFASLAQLVEQLTLNQRVAGSNPARGIALLLRISESPPSQPRDERQEQCE